MFEPGEWRRYRELRLRALADSPDAFARTLDEESELPDTHWMARLAAETVPRWDAPFVAERGSELVGLAWGRIDPPGAEVAHLYQMWVDAGSRKLGVGAMLLDSVVRWAASAGARYLVLGVTCGDTPARRLYARAGFEPVGGPGLLRDGSALLGQTMQLELRTASR